jgi:hypothetical protein
MERGWPAAETFSSNRAQRSRPTFSPLIVPAPSIGHGILAFLAVGGMFFGGKLLENLKKRHLHSA